MNSPCRGMFTGVHIEHATVDELLGYVDRIASSRVLDWDLKYSAIFDSRVAGRITPLIQPRHGYVDPDASYEEDVRAYARVCRKIARERADIAAEGKLSL